MEKLGLFHVIIFLLILAFEFYMSTFGDPQKIGFKIPEGLEDNEIEQAKIFSLLFSSPAYIIGGLVAFNIIRQIFF